MISSAARQTGLAGAAKPATEVIASDRRAMQRLGNSDKVVAIVPRKAQITV
jgi:hypothetical protein